MSTQLFILSKTTKTCVELCTLRGGQKGQVPPYPEILCQWVSIEKISANPLEVVTEHVIYSSDYKEILPDEEVDLDCEMKWSDYLKKYWGED